MSETLHGTSDVVHGDDLCIRDPGGEGRASLPSNEADHTPPTDPDALDHMLAPVADALWAEAHLQPGESVLDLGCGCGATTLAAAHAVGPRGMAQGVDVTPSMLAIARGRLAASRLANVKFHEADTQTHPLPGSFDVAISRFGTMFFDDPVAAFTNIRRALRPNGRLCMATWQPLDANAWLVVPGAALLRWITLPDLDGSGPGMFSQSDPEVVAAALDAAGYADIAVRPLKLALPLGDDVDHAAERLADTGVGRAALAAVPEEQQRAALDAVRDALAAHAGTEGVLLGAAVLITTATAPR
jgi:SAM-dependent methyltransferase